MPNRENLSEYSPAQSLVPAQRTGTANGTGVDLRGYDSATVEIDAGATGGTSPSFTFEVKESDDNSTYTAVADTDLDGTEPTITAANQNQIHRLGYKGSKRYIRVDITAASGTSPTLDCAARVLRGHPHVSPAG